MPKSNNKKHNGFSDMMTSGIFALPSDALLGEVRLEMRGSNLLFISGCRRIIKYAADQIIIGVKGRYIDIKGSCLLCTTYHYGTVTVEGCISSICFEGKGE